MYKTIREEELEVFFGDMELLGFNRAEAKKELARLEGCHSELDYIKASRVGATVRLTRAMRREVYDSYSLWVSKEVA